MFLRLLCPLLLISTSSAADLELIRVSDQGTHFVGAESERTFIVWGVNYDHDFEGLLLEDYWHDQWETVVGDFREIKDLGSNVVRIHLQFAKFMDAPDEPNTKNLKQLAKLVQVAEETGLYLDITGLGCYHKQDVPKWYDEMSETERWNAQARFWTEIAKVCQSSPAVFCYDLMNEPIIGGANPEDGWLAGELGGKHFVQRITLTPGDRDRKAIAKAWITKLTTAIRKVDQQHMITVGVIPWAHTWPNAKPLFHDPDVGQSLDFVAVHFYPEKGKVDKALAALKVYEIGKPLVVEEMFPLKSSIEEVDEFVDRSRSFTDGYVSFYWGKTIEENAKSGDFKGALMAKWLEYWASKAPEIKNNE
ncbi:MAG: cellulase family glycosylhydrolase [Planctomycetaceae bacterium]|nr:cellulase family glycosylhydrolase [Planctomycetaceae bacterium]